MAGIGFAGSYSTRRALALRKGFGWFAYAFPVGIDAGILVLYALDLALTRRGKPLPLLRLAAHGLTAATVAFNASASGPLSADPLGAAMHGVIPLLFVVSIEAARRLVRDDDAPRTSGPPLSRWLLSPGPTFAIWRRMRLWDVRSYDDAVTLYRESVIYRRRLAQRFGRWAWRFRANAEALLPVTMARYGLTVDEALSLPQQERERDRLRTEAEERAAAEAAEAAELRRLEAQVRRVEAEGRIRAAEAEVQVAEVEAEARRRLAAAKAGAAEAELTDEAEARRRRRALEEAEAAEAAQATARRRAAEEARQAAEAEFRAAEEARQAAEARRRAAEEARRAEEEEAARRAAAAEAERREEEARRAAAEAEHRAAEEARQAAEARRRAAEEALRAAEADDAARLSPAERQARRLARLIQERAQAGQPEPSLAEISELFGVASSTASTRRSRAYQILGRPSE